MSCVEQFLARLTTANRLCCRGTHEGALNEHSGRGQTSSLPPRPSCCSEVDVLVIPVWWVMFSDDVLTLLNFFKVAGEMRLVGGMSQMVNVFTDWLCFYREKS